MSVCTCVCVCVHVLPCVPERSCSALRDWQDWPAGVHTALSGEPGRLLGPGSGPGSGSRLDGG